MNDQNFKEESKENLHLKQLIIEGKHDEALQLIDKTMKKENLSHHNVLSYNLLKCDIFYQQGLWEKVIEIAKKVYQESLELEENLLTIDALLKIAESFVWLFNSTKFTQNIQQAKNLLESKIEKPSIDYDLRKATLFFVEGFFNAWIKFEADKALEPLEQSIKLYDNLGEYGEIIKPVIFSAFVIGLLKMDLDHAIKLAERSLALSKQSNNKFAYALSLLILGTIYGSKERSENSIKLLEESLVRFKELNNMFFIAYCLNYIGNAYMNKGDLDKGLEYAEQALVIAREINNKRQIVEIVNIVGSIYGVKGDFDRSLHFYEEGLNIFKELKNNRGVAALLSNMSWIYKSLGDLEKALESIEISINIFNESGDLSFAANSYDNLIQILIDKGNLSKAQEALKKLEELKDQLKDEHINELYLFDKALLLKMSSRARDRGKAEEFLKQIITNEKLGYATTTIALLNLCELLLTELQMTNDLEVLDELNSYTNHLLKGAKKSHSYIVFAETYFLKGKLSLLTLDIKTARRFLTQAQRIAERFGFNQLAIKITTEHNNLREKLSIWKDLEKKEFSLSERIKLAGLDTHMKEVLQKGAIITTQISVHKITVHREQKVCLICKGEISGFMYTCNCDALYCESCARALTDLENACWVCSAPIDISKPSKPYKEEKLKDKVFIKKIQKK